MAASTAHQAHALLFAAGLLVMTVSAIEDAAGSELTMSFAIQVTIRENTTDGCVSCGCQSKAVLQSGHRKRWWMTFGLVKPSADGSWQRSGPLAHAYCGEGKFRSVKQRMHETRGIPYVIVELETVLDKRSADIPGPKARWSISTLKEFDSRGRPRYRVQKRQQHEDSRDELESAVVALVSSDLERAEFRVQEIVATVKASRLTENSPGHGNISVQSDIPGAEIFVDGGHAGRVGEHQPLLIENVAAGLRHVSVRDYSARTREQSVQATAGQTVNVRLELLPNKADEVAGGFLRLGRNESGFEEYWRIPDGAIVVQIPAGEFSMGSDHPQSDVDERPARQVYLDAFLIDKTEVTWRQFRKFADSRQYPLPPAPLWGRLDDYALSHATWEDARSYCSWVGGRLPTEAEWEKAARGDDGRDFPWGQKWDPNRCNSISGGMHRPEPVGSYHGCVSPFGVLDMVGSHWQWISDYYDKTYYATAPYRNPAGPPAGTGRVKRGGYWMSHPTQLRVTRRGSSAPDWKYVAHGFRCAQDIPEQFR